MMRGRGKKGEESGMKVEGFSRILCVITGFTRWLHNFMIRELAPEPIGKRVSPVSPGTLAAKVTPWNLMRI